MSTDKILKAIKANYKKSMGASQPKKLSECLALIDCPDGKKIGIVNLHLALTEVGLTLSKASMETALSKLRKKNESN